MRLTGAAFFLNLRLEYAIAELKVMAPVPLTHPASFRLSGGNRMGVLGPVRSGRRGESAHPPRSRIANGRSDHLP